MNSLNLRVSSVKTGENVKKNAEMRATLMTLPKQYETATEFYCIEFKNAKSIPEQVTVVKNIFKNLGSDPQALQFLADLYFSCPLKHPVRNQILKLLITASRLGTGGVDDARIVAALVRSLQAFVQQGKTEIESSSWNTTITSLSGCFENFDCGLKALQECIDVVLPFLCAALQRFLTELSVLSSPSVRNEYYLYVHNAIRLLLSCVQEFGVQLQAPFADDLQQLKQICRQIILDDEIPMDPRTNCGILLAHLAKMNDDYESFIQDVKETRQPNEIALCVGVVNTCTQHDFQLYSADVRDICGKIEQIANANATTPNILLCAARALYQYSKLILIYDLKTHAALDDAKLILRKLLIFSFGYLEHHMDSVRHICRDLLRNIVAAAHKIKFDFLLQKIYDACNSERLSLSMKCVVLQQTAGVLGAEAVISNCPTLFSALFAEHLGRDFIVNNLFEALMSISHKELSHEAWFKLWIQYLLDIAQENDERLPDIEILIVKAVKCAPQLVENITEPRDRKVPISTKLSALWAVRKAGINLDNFNEIMQKFSRSLLLSILCNCDDTRIMALRLLVETHKTTEPLSALECGHLLTYLEYNGNTQSPATRHKSVALLSKALVRCELNLHKEQKVQPLPVSTGAIPKGSTSSAAKNKPSAQQKFLVDFIQILVANLFPDANFSRRTISLQLLEQSLRICINCDLPLPQILPQYTVDALTMMLGDSYEANKELVVHILKMLENKFDESLIESYQLPILLGDVQQLLTSVRPMDSMTGAYQLDFYCNRAKPQVFGEYELPEYHATHFAALRWLLLQLRNGHKLAKENIVRAAKENPLYGLLYAVKHFLQRLDFQAIAQEIAWRILIAELIVLCKELTTVVAPVVNSASPEGHLPNDFSVLSSEFAAQFDIKLEEEEDVELKSEEENSEKKKGSPKKNILSTTNKNSPPPSTSSSSSTTPQMLLLCAWRTVKEVSLILGDIVLRSPIQYSNLTVQFLLTKEQILEIGEHFKQLLAETKHRGAFEQAYVGFAKLCCRLWRVEAVDLNSLPMQWLRELIAMITRPEQSNEKMCATRRSAGVPFMAQALITAELQVGTTKSLYFCMSHLLQLCHSGGGVGRTLESLNVSLSSSPSSVGGASSSSTTTTSTQTTERTVESRTHALNILRALFRCTDLSEAVGEFVSDGVMCALRAYDASNWSERNSATLLYAALITRIFGVQRTKDAEQLNIRNRMTGRVFFLRYPKLYDFFLEQLRDASELVKEQQKAQKLHPLLLIMSRLYPSALEGTESNLKLSAFLPYITDCAGCAEMQTRYLAAKALVALIARDTVVETILNICAQVVTSTSSPQANNLNLLHGRLLQIQLLLKSLSHPSDELIGDVSCTLVSYYECTQIKNAVILKVMLDICIELMQRYNTFNVAQNTIQQLLYFSTQKIFQSPDESKSYVVLRKTFFIYNLHTLRLTLPYGAISDYLLSPPVTHESVPMEQAETCLNIILLILLCTPAQSPTFAALSSETASASTSAAAASSSNNNNNDISTPSLNYIDADQIAEFEISPIEVQFVRVMQSEMLIELSSELRKSQTLQNTLKELLKQPRFYPACAGKAYAILSMLDHYDYTLAQLMKDVRDRAAVVKSQLTMCVERYVLVKRQLDLKTAQMCLEYMTEITQPWQDDNLRWRATKILALISPHYIKALEKKKLPFIRLYLGLMLSLLMDDDFDVRDLAARIVLSNLPDNIELPDVVSTMAQRLFIQYTADILLSLKSDDNYIIDIFKIISDLMNNTSLLPDDNVSTSSGASSNASTGTVTGDGGVATILDTELFDKNEANVFAEPQKTISDTLVVFKNTFKQYAKVMSFLNDYSIM